MESSFEGAPRQRAPVPIPAGSHRVARSRSSNEVRGGTEIPTICRNFTRNAAGSGRQFRSNFVVELPKKDRVVSVGSGSNSSCSPIIKSLARRRVARLRTNFHVNDATPFDDTRSPKLRCLYRPPRPRGRETLGIPWKFRELRVVVVHGNQFLLGNIARDRIKTAHRQRVRRLPSPGSG